jgi:hypothetical protein
MLSLHPSSFLRFFCRIAFTMNLSLIEQIVFRAYPDMSSVKRTTRQKKQNKHHIANEMVAAIKADPVKRDAA